MNGGSSRLDDNDDAVVVAVAEPVEGHHSDFDVDLCSLVCDFAPHEPEAVHPCRYRGPAAGRLAAVAHARLAARRYYATRWLRTPRPRRAMRKTISTILATALLLTGLYLCWVWPQSM